MKPTGRLHFYPPTGPQSTGYIIADRQALKGLAEAARAVCTSEFEWIKVFSADGHEYRLFITSAVSEEEWQKVPLHYGQQAELDLGIVDNYNSLKQELKSTY